MVTIIALLVGVVYGGGVMLLYRGDAHPLQVWAWPLAILVAPRWLLERVCTRTLVEGTIELIEDKFFGFLPMLSREEAAQQGREWIPDREYYFTDDKSPRIAQRLRAIWDFDENAVSYWKRRRAALRRCEPFME